MTPRQQQVYAFLAARAAEGDVSPSYDEIGAAIGLTSKSGICRLVRALEARGLLRRLPGRARSIEVLRAPGAPARPAPHAVVAAAQRLLDSIQHEDPRRGVALVGSDALGDLDIALAEARP